MLVVLLEDLEVGLSRVHIGREVHFGKLQYLFLGVHTVLSQSLVSLGKVFRGQLLEISAWKRGSGEALIRRFLGAFERVEEVSVNLSGTVSAELGRELLGEFSLGTFFQIKVLLYFVVQNLSVIGIDYRRPQTPIR